MSSGIAQFVIYVMAMALIGAGCGAGNPPFLPGCSNKEQQVFGLLKCCSEAADSLLIDGGDLFLGGAKTCTDYAKTVLGPSYDAVCQVAVPLGLECPTYSEFLDHYIEEYGACAAACP